MKTTLTLCAALIAAAPLAAQTTQLSSDRLSDEAISADQQAYESLQGRIQGLNERGRPLREYFMAKAQCWLDVSFHEYTRNDRSAFPQAALNQAETLIVGMERGTDVLSLDTPLLNGAARLRPDLWERSAALKVVPAFRCAQRQIACAEVELVHAGNEFQQQQWRHARPYVQIAEDQINEAQTLVEQCDAAPAPAARSATVATAAVTTPAAAAAVASTATAAATAEAARGPELQAQLVFDFDRSDRRSLRPSGLAQLDELLARIRREGLRITGIRLVGHADRLNGTRSDHYNQRLSERRVGTVRDALVERGVDGALISTDAKGDQVPVSRCAARYASQAELEACLLPNRRVDVRIDTKKP